MGVSGKLEKGDGTGGEQQKMGIIKGNIKYITKSDMTSAITQYWELKGQ